jgi:hypothetical protein
MLLVDPPEAKFEATGIFAQVGKAGRDYYITPH